LLQTCKGENLRLRTFNWRERMTQLDVEGIGIWHCLVFPNDCKCSKCWDSRRNCYMVILRLSQILQTSHRHGELSKEMHFLWKARRWLKHSENWQSHRSLNTKNQVKHKANNFLKHLLKTGIWR
jgi:hypothetical protein